MKFRPLDDRVVVELIAAEGVTPGGIVLPDNAKEKSRRGLVTAVGPGTRLDDGSVWPLSVKIGDEVLFHEFAGQEIEDGIKVLRESDILGIIEK